MAIHLQSGAPLVRNRETETRTETMGKYGSNRDLQLIYGTSIGEHKSNFNIVCGPYNELVAVYKPTNIAGGTTL